MQMTEVTTMSDERARAEVQAALARAGLRASPEQLARFMKTHQHMQARLALLRRQLDPSVPPVLVFPASAWAALETPDGT
jgi:hypothetical protein